MNAAQNLPRTLGEALAYARGRIDLVDARLLLRTVADVSAVALVAFPERGLTQEVARLYADWIERREAGEPVAYIIGEREFYGRVFKVTSATLIPRPETELLVDLALKKLHGIDAPRILDLGTGTGAIAITLALQLPHAYVMAVDASQAALAVAMGNARRLGANVHTVHGNWFAQTADARFDLIVSNPPYVAADDPHLQRGDLRFEPRNALAAGADGLDDIRHIVATAPSHLLAGGCLLLEHGYDQAAAVRALLNSAGFDETRSWRDLADIERVTGGRCETGNRRPEY